MWWRHPAADSSSSGRRTTVCGSATTRRWGRRRRAVGAGPHTGSRRRAPSRDANGRRASFPVHTLAVTDRECGAESEPLEVIDLSAESEMPARASRRPSAGVRFVWLAVLVGCAVVLGVVLTGRSRTGGDHTVHRPEPLPSTPVTTPIHRPRGPIVGDYYPELAP